MARSCSFMGNDNLPSVESDMQYEVRFVICKRNKENISDCKQNDKLI